MFSSRASSNFANTRSSSSASQAKSFAGQGAHGGSSARMFKGPTPPSNPYGVSAHFDVAYYNVDPSHQPRSRNSWFNMFPDPKNHFQFPPGPSKTPNVPRGSSDMHHQKSSSFSIYPGMSRDMFIYEASNSEFSSPANSLTPIPFSPALSTDSLDSMDDLESPIDVPPSQGRPPSRSSTPAPSTSSNPQAGLKGILRTTPQSQNPTPNSGRYGQQQPQSFVPFMPEREAELDHISRMNTELNSNTRFPPGGVHPNAGIPVEHRDIPSQIYRDMPLSSSPESYEDSMYAHETGRDRRSRGSFAPVVPPPQMEPSISQSTTSTLDPNHPLLQPPSSTNGMQGQRQMLFEAPGSDSDGSTATMTLETGSGRRSSPPNFSRPRSDSGARPSTTPLPGANGVSINLITPVENVSSISSQYHQGSPPRRGSAEQQQPPVMPIAPLGSGSFSQPPHVQTAVSDTSLGAAPFPPLTIPPPRSRPQAVTLTTVESGSSSASERTIHDHDSSPRLDYRDIQRTSVGITSTRGPSAPTSATSSRPRSGSVSASTAPLPQFNTIPSSAPSRSSPPSASQVEQRHTSSPPRVTVNAASNNNTSVIPDPSLVEDAAYSHSRTRTPGPKRSHSDGDNPIYSGATLRSATPFRTEFAPNVATSNPTMQVPHPLSSSSSHPEPRRRYSDEQPPAFSRAPVTVTPMGPSGMGGSMIVGGGSGGVPHPSQVPLSVATRSVRWNKNLICPSPVLPCNRRKGWFNRRGDQLWTNSGSYKAAPAGQEYPPDLDSYPEFGEGWMNEEGVKIDMMHRLVPKVPLRSALKQTRASNHA